MIRKTHLRPSHDADIRQVVPSWKISRDDTSYILQL